MDEPQVESTNTAAAPVAPLPVPPPPRKSKTWVWVLVIVLTLVLLVCPLASCAGLYFVGVNYQNKTQQLIQSAPSGEKAVFRGIIRSSNEIGGDNIGLSNVNNPSDIYVITLNPYWEYYIDERLVTPEEFFSVATKQMGLMCEMTYDREGIISLEVLTR